jgi:hypothetical protein
MVPTRPRVPGTMATSCSPSAEPSWTDGGVRHVGTCSIRCRAAAAAVSVRANSSAWLERTPDKGEVGGSSPPWPTEDKRRGSAPWASAGQAATTGASSAGGRPRTWNRSPLSRPCGARVVADRGPAGKDRTANGALTGCAGSTCRPKPTGSPAHCVSATASASFAATRSARLRAAIPRLERSRTRSAVAGFGRSTPSVVGGFDRLKPRPQSRFSSGRCRAPVSGPSGSEEPDTRAHLCETISSTSASRPKKSELSASSKARSPVVGVAFGVDHWALARRHWACAPAATRRQRGHLPTLHRSVDLRGSARRSRRRQRPSAARRARPADRTLHVAADTCRMRWPQGRW